MHTTGTHTSFEREAAILREKRVSLTREIARSKQKLTSLREDLQRVDAALSALEGTSEGVDNESAPDHTGKYRPLWASLVETDDDRIKMTFNEVEELLGFELPPSARTHQSHWHGYTGSAVARAIRDAGFRASKVDREEETVEFLRLTHKSTDGQSAFPMTPKGLAAKIVDLAIGAPLGTTPESDILWHSPAITHVYNRLRAAGMATIDGRYRIDSAFHDAVVSEFQDRVAHSSDKGDALRRKFAHTNRSGWTRRGGRGNTPLPRHSPEEGKSDE